MRVWILLLLAACRGGEDGHNGEAGIDGATGPTGPAGAPGASATGYRWHDATGAQVTLGSDLSIIDPAGVLWPIDPETLEIRVEAEFDRGYYTQTGCVGEEYATNVTLPRFPMGIYEGASLAYYVRPDALALEELHIVSVELPTGCAPSDSFPLVVPVSELIAVQRPAVPWTAPLHPEPVE